ncbi:WxL domain-containing protein, partial [Enterococcus sp. AZ007]|uniref:leucine-rich repeat domain-containing protein n=1 Tax=Enterococcus sp. AZ007 TaxID=2774839 RepID=UPI003F2125D4
MNRILRLFFCVSLLAAPCLGAGTATVVAETEVPEETVVSTIPTMATEPAVSQPDDSATIPEKETEPSKDKLEDVPEPEVTNESEEKEEQADKHPTTKGASPYAVTLIEGVDIDAEFAQRLRTYKLSTNKGAAWSGRGKGQDQLTKADMEDLTHIQVQMCNFSSLKGIEYAINLESLSCAYNNLTTLDVSNNPLLTVLYCDSNQLTNLDVTNNPKLDMLWCKYNKLTSLDLSSNALLTDLDCSGNQLTSLDINDNSPFVNLRCASNTLSTLALDVNNRLSLTTLDCSTNQLTSLDVSNTPKLISLNCYSNNINSLDVSDSPLLEILSCGYNYTSGQPSLSSLNLSANPLLRELFCEGNRFGDYSLDLTDNPLLEVLHCSGNNISNLDLSNNSSLEQLVIVGNKLTNLNLISASANPLLKTLYCSDNQITDITGAFGLTNLTFFSASNQSIQAGIPPIVGGNATVDLLKTSASTGLSLSNISLGGSPILTPNGDKIELGNVTYADLDNKELQFNYSGSDLTEGASSGSKSYDGTIRFAPVSDLESQLVLVPEDEKKVESGGTVNWKWTIKSINPLKAENVHATLTLPTGLVIDPSSIKRDGVSVSLSDIDGTTNLGDLDQHQSITFKFTTTASGNANDWLKAIGRLDWQDSQSRTNQTDCSVQIKDDEQTYTPKTQEDMALLSVPESFRFGFWDVKNTAQTFSLHSSNYLTNTEVVSEGFYTRLRDDRAVNSGWKLSAQLSDFKDSTSE